MANLLLVDDHVLFREGLASLFDHQPDFKLVGEAGTVREAIRKAHDLKPDLILMDFNLPDGNGLEATQAILAENPATKIVFLTINEDDEQILEAIRRGAKGYLFKNLSVSDLLASLRALQCDELAISRRVATRLLEKVTHPHKTVDPHAPREDLLSPRELEVLRELEQGNSNQEIAQRLVISINTVKNHLQNIYEKLKLRNRREAADYAARLGLGKK